MSDIVDDIFNRIKNILGDDFKGEIALKLENEEKTIRQFWGGTTSYILRKKIDKERRKKAMEELKKGVPVKQVSEITGMSKVHIYRLLRVI